MMSTPVRPTVEGAITSQVFKALKAKLGALVNSSVTVGVHKDAGRYPDGVTVAQVALWNEFGTIRAPERSFFRRTLKRDRQSIKDDRLRAVAGILNGKLSVEKALSAVGAQLAVRIQNTIKSNVPPPLKARTLAARRARGNNTTRTLIDAGLLLRSVAWKVKLTKGAP